MEKKINRMESWRLKDFLYAVISNEGVFLFAAVLLYGFGRMQTLDLYSEERRLLDQFVMVPWGMAMVISRLNRTRGRRSAADVLWLFTLLTWITVPFIIRFGFKINQVVWSFRYMVVFFGLYASLTERENMDRILDWASGLFSIVSFVIAGALLYCAWTVTTYGTCISTYGFGVDLSTNIARVSLSLNPNPAAILEGCCVLMCLLGVVRRKSLLGKMAHLVSAGMMMIALVLTQSRTSRYAMLAALAVGSYGVIACSKKIAKPVYRQLTAILAAVLVLIGGYAGANQIMNATLRNFERNPLRVVQPSWYEAVSEEETEHTSAVARLFQMILPEALADETEIAPNATPAPQYQTRQAIDPTLSLRTVFWKNVLQIWKENPKQFLIGFGRDGAYEQSTLAGFFAPVIDNAPMEFIMNYGMIAFVLLVGFFLSIMKPILRVFFAPAEKAFPGGRVLCMVVIYALLVGVMESQPLVAMEAINLVFFFALGVLVNRGRKLAEAE